METGNQNTNQETNVTANEAKTFTQAELDAIVQDRVKRERQKYEGFEDLKAKAQKYDEQEEANKSELQKAQERATELEQKLKQKEHEDNIRDLRKKVADELKVPAELLTADTEEECRTQAQAIMSFATSQGYPAVKDGGEPNTTQKKAARDAFKEWADSNFS